MLTTHLHTLATLRMSECRHYSTGLNGARMDILTATDALNV